MSNRLEFCESSIGFGYVESLVTSLTFCFLNIVLEKWEKEEIRKGTLLQRALKILAASPAVVAHTFSPSTRGAETGGSL